MHFDTVKRICRFGLVIDIICTILMIASGVAFKGYGLLWCEPILVFCGGVVIVISLLMIGLLMWDMLG